jgi:hypothetical protein
MSGNIVQKDDLTLLQSWSKDLFNTAPFVLDGPMDGPYFLAYRRPCAAPSGWQPDQRPRRRTNASVIGVTAVTRQNGGPDEPWL